MRYTAFLILIITISLGFHKQGLAEDIDLFIMAGQSNMQGWRSDAAQYPYRQRQLDKRIPFYFEAIDYDSSQEQWTYLKAQRGHFRRGHFGPEITFARAIKQAGYNPAIFKYSAGSSSLKHQWKSPGENGLYDDMIGHLLSAITQLEMDGHNVYPRGFIWIQGESDAVTQAIANEYYWRLRKLIHDIRHNVLKTPELPVILGLDEQHPYVRAQPSVVDAQLKLSQDLPRTRRTSMLGLEKSDSTHLTAQGTTQQGLRLFQLYRNSFSQ